MITSINVKYTGRSDLQSAKQNFLNHPPKQTLIQVFSGLLEIEKIESLLVDLKTEFPHVSVIGTTTAGEIMDNTLPEEIILVNISFFDYTLVHSVLVDQNDDLVAAGKKIGSNMASNNPRAVILFGCGLKEKRTIDATTMLSALRAELPQTVIAGAQAGDNGNGINTFVFTEQGITDKGVAAASLSSEKLIVNNSYNLSWIPIGKNLTITKAIGPRVYSIDNQTPYDLYSNYLGQDVADGLPLSAADFPLIIERDGIRMAIHATGVNDDGSFDYIHSFHAGEQVKFGFCHAGLLATGARETYDELRANQVQAAFIYSCVSRKWILGADVSVEISPIASLAPTSGFFAYGEYFSHPNGKCLFLSQTMTVLTLAEANGSEEQIVMEELPPPITDEESKQLKTLRVLHRLVDTSANEIESNHTELAQMASRDYLTGLANRRHLDNQFEIELQRCQRSDKPFSIIMLDIDHFKLFNDNYGHVAGDNCLRGVAQVINGIIKRPADIVARYGGEEFACILPDTEYDSAIIMAEQMRQNVEGLLIPNKASVTSKFVTISIGVITVTGEMKKMNIEQLFKLCDQQLYAAKSKGRNRVVGTDKSRGSE